MYCESCGKKSSEGAKFCAMCGQKIVAWEESKKLKGSEAVKSASSDKIEKKPAVTGAVAVFAFLIFISIPFVVFALVGEILSLNELNWSAIGESISGFTFFAVTYIITLIFRLLFLVYSLYLACRLKKRLPEIFFMLGVFLIIVELVCFSSLHSLSSSDPNIIAELEIFRSEAIVNPLATFVYVIFWTLVLRSSGSAKKNLIK